MTARRPSTLVWLASRLRPHVVMLVISTVARVIGQTLSVAMLALAGVSVLADSAARPMLIGVLIGTAVIKAVLSYVEHFTGHHLAFTSLQRMREQFFDALLPLAPAATRGSSGDELAVRATRDIDRIEVFFAHTVPPAVAAVVVPIIAIGGYAIVADPGVALLMAGLSLCGLGVSVAMSAISGTRGARAVARARADVVVHVSDDIRGAQTIRSFGAERQRADERTAKEGRLVAAQDRLGLWEAVRMAWAGLVLAGGFAAVVLVVPADDVYALVIGVAVAMTLWRPSGGLDEFASGLVSAFAAAERVRHIIDGEPAVRDDGRRHPSGGNNAPNLRGVSFRYPGEDHAPAVIEDLTLWVQSGVWLTITGVTGSGKSTIAALMARGWDPQGGTVMLGETEATEFTLSALRAHTMVLTHHADLLPMTIAENLRLVAADASLDEIRAALHVVGLRDWVAAQEHDLDTIVGERGGTLSGGQRQRLALARAVLARPPVLVLDESLSELDEPTLTAVRARLQRERVGLTTIEITHRADLLGGDDRVAVVDGGRIVQCGRAADLVLEAGPFRRVLDRVSAQ